jgi:hypothetical protein
MIVVLQKILLLECVSVCDDDVTPSISHANNTNNNNFLLVFMYWISSLYCPEH